jgi:hypothetical protein
MARAALGCCIQPKRLARGSSEMAEEVPFRRAPRPRRGFRLASRDKAILRWIGRLRLVGAAHVAERFELGRAVTYARLDGLGRSAEGERQGDVVTQSRDAAAVVLYA